MSRLTEEEKRSAKPISGDSPPEGAVLVFECLTYVQTFRDTEHYYRTPDGQLWKDSDWLRKPKRLNKKTWK